ncbi:reverse transcriptase domain-containing protein [Tanacetum coccineum]
MAEEDEEKTTFITNQGLFCYTKIPFGLRNARATYQRLVDKAFHKQIGKNFEVYVDDLVIKSRTEDEIVRDIEETFKTLREINMKLNPKKCTFGIEEGMFLGYKVGTRGLKIAEAEEVFKQMKQLIAELLMLVTPMEKEELIVYLAAAKETVSAVLMTERKAKQMPIYFVSRALRGPEVNYTSMEKLVLALVHASKRLKRPRVSVKGQILADFIVARPEEESPDTLIEEEEEEELPEPWILFTDGSSCTDGSRAGLILTNPEGMKFTYALRFRFDATNNEAEYEALIAGLKIAEQMGVKNLQENVPRSENKKADALSKIASTSFAHLSKQVLVEELKEKSVSAAEVMAIVEEEGDTWMTPIFKYLTDGTLPVEVKKARAWGIDIAGPFLEGSGKVKFLIVDIDYFTKWIEAKLVVTITDNPFKDWCEKLCIRQHFASVKHLQTNGLVERANRSLGEGIKARLDERSKNWMEEFPHVLWAHRTMIKSSNGDTPFSLTYRTEAVILAEIGMPTLRTPEVELIQNNKALEINLDLLEERREQVAIREAKSKAKMERYYNTKVHSTSFKLGDLVYRNNDASRTEDIGKLGLKWKGPYEVTEALGKGAYKLRDRDGKQLPRTWNISNLKKCYIYKM